MGFSRILARVMKMLKRCAGLFACGGIGYAAVEVLWRGYTHWTMALTGGTVLIGLESLRRRLRREKLSQRCLAGAALITTAELIVGMVVNRRYGLGVWDYSRERLNFKGQICAKYALLWFFLSAPAMALSKAVTFVLEPEQKRLAPHRLMAYNDIGEGQRK